MEFLSAATVTRLNLPAPLHPSDEKTQAVRAARYPLYSVRQPLRPKLPPLSTLIEEFTPSEYKYHVS